jgi:glycosyltransferase involved in cell wall biosynthesis
MVDYPLISVIIPVFNGSNYVDEAIESVLNQGYSNLEIIVVDDASTDMGATADILKSYGDAVSVIAHEQNLGVSGALNSGINSAKGDYLTWLSHDDKMVKNRFETLIPIALANPQKIIYSDFMTITSNCEIIRSNSNEGSNFIYSQIQPSNILEHLITGRLNGCTLLIPRNKMIHKFDENLKFTQDYQMWLTLANEASFIYVDKPLIQARIHTTNDSLKPEFVTAGNNLWIAHLESLLIKFNKNPANYLQFYIYLSNSPFRLALAEYLPFLEKLLNSDVICKDTDSILKKVQNGLPVVIIRNKQIEFNQDDKNRFLQIFLFFIGIRKYFDSLTKKQILELISVVKLGSKAKLVLTLILFTKGLSRRLLWRLLKFMFSFLDLNISSPTVVDEDQRETLKSKDSNITNRFEIMKILLEHDNSTIIYYGNGDLKIVDISDQNRYKSILRFMKSIKSEQFRGRLFFE